MTNPTRYPAPVINGRGAKQPRSPNATSPRMAANPPNLFARSLPDSEKTPLSLLWPIDVLALNSSYDTPNSLVLMSQGLHTAAPDRRL